MSRAPRWLCVATWILLATNEARAERQNVPAADTPSEDAVGSARRGQALQSFNQGTLLFEQGQYQAALHAFETSLALYPTRSALKNQALCLERLGRPSDALDVLEALPLRFPNFSPEERRAYDEKLAELSARVGFIELRGAEAGLEIRIGERVRGTTPLASALRVSPGMQRVELRKAGAAPIVNTLEVRAGQSRVLELGTPLTASAARTAEPRRPAIPDADPSSGSPTRRHRPWLGVDASALLADGAADAPCDAGCEAGLAFGGRVMLAAGYPLARAWNVTVQAGYVRLVQDVENRDIAAEVRGAGDVAGLLDERLTLSGVVLGVGLEHRLLPFLILRAGVGALLLGAHTRREADLVIGAAPERVDQTQRVRGDFVQGSLGALMDHAFGDHLRVGVGADVSLAYALRRPKWNEEELFESSAGLGRFRSAALARETLLLALPGVVARYEF
ncbi:MAG TPA: tetratricopeptide repeat protein [Polyangiaceae bacterium]